MLRDLRTPRIEAYRPIRVGIAARAILKYHYARHDLVYSQVQALHQFVQTFPYIYWHPNITSLIHEDRRDTPEDRRNLHDAVMRLLAEHPGVSAYVLGQAINAVVQRPPPAAPTPASSQVPPASLSSPAAPLASQVSPSAVSTSPITSQTSLSHLPVQFRRSALGGPAQSS
ncbi:hypothetical protein PENSPDRAFT_492653 [Peniophora sp. CONT]|nr:hypothetical protein PENSPDRAFT_492653 [Peniophora sp. CONT]